MIRTTMTAALAAMLLAGAAAAQAPPNETAAERNRRIATQPTRDLGMARRQIPEILMTARADAYSTAGMRTCGGIDAEVQRLNAVLGPDFDSNREDKFKLGKNLVGAGGESLVNTIIPFRGLVREATGAANQDRRYTAAVLAGATRRGFLKGLAQSRRCRLSPYVDPRVEADAAKDEAKK